MSATALKLQEYIQDNIAPEPQESPEAKLRRIARAAEEACKDSADFEEFTLRYGIRASSFV